MNRSVLCKIPLMLVILWASASISAVAAPPKKEEPKQKKEVTGEGLKKVLDSSVTVEFDNQPLPEVLAKLTEDHGIAFVLDRNVLQQMGIDPTELTIDYKAKGVKLRVALRNLLNGHQLSFAVIGEGVFISTEENVVYRQFKQRIAINLEGAPLLETVKNLSKQYGVNIVIDPRANGLKSLTVPLTLQLDDVPLEAAIRLLCEMAGVKPARIGNVLLITTEERVEKLRDTESLVPNPALPIGNGTGVIPLGAPFGGIGGGINPPPQPKKEEPKEDPKQE